MNPRDRWYRGAAIAAVAMAAALAAPPAAAQQQKLPETYVRSAPVATSATLDVDEQVAAPTGLRPGPTPTPEGGLAGAEVGASDQDGFNDSALNERAKLAYPE